MYNIVSQGLLEIHKSLCASESRQGRREHFSGFGVSHTLLLAGVYFLLKSPQGTILHSISRNI